MPYNEARLANVLPVGVNERSVFYYMAIRFELGQLVATSEVARFMNENQKFSQFIQDCLQRYISCDWGVLDELDYEANNEAVDEDGRILASYPIPNDIPIDWEDKIWIITEWDRSYTTILFPDEY